MSLQNCKLKQNITLHLLNWLKSELLKTPNAEKAWGGRSYLAGGDGRQFG
jgi:hypothetical protein